ncbi:MAG: hypothetical protein U5K37_02445, partial [Natrialbaceae archaeon]|nr:hypothetical protein [Natrialbaceae archaeon]
EYVQEAITTLHDLGDPPDVEEVDSLIAESAIVVPMTEHEQGTEAASRVFSTLATIDPATVVVPIGRSQRPIGPMRRAARWVRSARSSHRGVPRRALEAALGDAHPRSRQEGAGCLAGPGCGLRAGRPRRRPRC